jgi:hypothetical protein
MMTTPQQTETKPTLHPFFERMATKTKTDTKTKTKKFSDVWDRMEHDETSMTFHGKVGVSWETMNESLEENYGDNGKDKHWKWRGFGTPGTAEFRVVLHRQRCSGWICDAEECDECGVLTCGLELHENGNLYCYDCKEQMEDDDEWEDYDTENTNRQCKECSTGAVGTYGHFNVPLCSGCRDEGNYDSSGHKAE